MKFFRRLLLFIILVGTVMFLFNYFDLPSSRDAKDYCEISIVDGIDTSDYSYILKDRSDISKGELILVNNSNPYPFIDKIDLVSVYDYKDSSYKVKDLTVTLHSSVINPLNDMLQDFHKQYKSSAITVISGYRTYDYQQSLYDQRAAEDGAVEAMKWVAQPGGSEHHTGYALDFGLYHDSGRSEPYEGTGRYRWINENAHRYGFIVRYTEDKREQTGIEYEPWHFRYIGKPHSNISAKLDMCLEEYMDYLNQFHFGKKHLKVTIGGGKQYEIYYTEQLEVPVPSNKQYKISGNNIDGFIVTTQNH